MRVALVLAAALLTIAGPAPAAVLLAGVSVARVVRSPEGLLDAAYILAFCGLGYLAR